MLSLSCLASACATKPPDVPVCVEINLTKARCVHIISGEAFVIDEEHKFEDKTWWEIRPAMMQVPASSWEKIRTFIVKICKKTDQCQREVTSWDRTVETVDQIIKK